MRCNSGNGHGSSHSDNYRQIGMTAIPPSAIEKVHDRVPEVNKKNGAFLMRFRQRGDRETFMRQYRQGERSSGLCESREPGPRENAGFLYSSMRFGSMSLRGLASILSGFVTSRESGVNDALVGIARPRSPQVGGAAIDEVPANRPSLCPTAKPELFSARA